MKIRTLSVTSCRYVLLWVTVALAACTSPLDVTSLPTSVSSANLHRYDAEWFDAARAGRWDILGPLLDAGFAIDSTTHAGYTALTLAAYDNHADIVDKLIARGANPCLADKHGNTALMGAIFKGYTPIATRLIDTRCDVNAQSFSGETALSFAALFGRVTLLQTLIARGADKHLRDSQGKTALMIALEQGNGSAVRILRDEH